MNIPRSTRLFAAVAAAAVTSTLMHFVVSLAEPQHQDHRLLSLAANQVSPATAAQAPTAAAPQSSRMAALQSSR